GNAWLGMDNSKLTLLIIGGSLGAKSINEFIDENLDAILSWDIQILWQTGKQYYEQATARCKGLEEKVKVLAFIQEMDYAYAAADMVISRAGALSIAELCIVAKPVIFVPYPFAAEDHQTSNAMALVEKNAAMMVKNDQVMTQLLPKLQSLTENIALRETMSENIQKMA